MYTVHTNKLICEGALFSLYERVLEKKNHKGLQRKANKPDCGAQPVEQLLFCPCGKFLTAHINPLQESIYF